MFSNAARFLMVSAAASLVSFGSASADACAGIADAAEERIFEGTYSGGTGAQFVNTAIMDLMGFTAGYQLRGLLDIDVGPNSHDYYNLIIDGDEDGAFEEITNVADIKRGDILAISGANYSGHSMIVRGPAEEITALYIPPLYADQRQWAVPIADTTSTVHGCNANFPDSRWTGPCKTGTFTQGAGTAYIRLYTDLAGNFQGHTWSVTASQSSYMAPSVRPYAIGRATFCP